MWLPKSTTQHKTDKQIFLDELEKQFKSDASYNNLYLLVYKSNILLKMKIIKVYSNFLNLQ